MEGREEVVRWRGGRRGERRGEKRVEGEERGRSGVGERMLNG